MDSAQGSDRLARSRVPQGLTALLAVALVACSPTPKSPGEQRTPALVAPPKATQREPEAKSRAEMALVWTRSKDDRTTTFWLRGEKSDLQIERQAPGIYLQAGGAEWQFQLLGGVMPLHSCESVLEEEQGKRGAPIGSKPTQAASLLALDSGKAWPLTDLPKPGADAYNDFSQGVALSAAAGRYLFLTEHSWVYTCGAHGSGSATFQVYDLVTRSVVSLLTDAELSAIKQAEMLEALEAFKANGDGFGEPKLEDVELVKTLPQFDSAGEPELVLVFALPTCYACTHGEWASYTATTRVTARQLPKALAEEPPPELVKQFARLGRAPVLGWSRQPARP